MYLRSNATFNCALIHGHRFNFEGCIKFKVSNAWGKSLSHNCIGNCGSVELSPDIKWTLKVYMDLSAAFFQCTCSGAS